MATPKWQPGKLYPPGSLVVPRTEQSSSPESITNPEFEDGSNGWTLAAGWSVIAVPDAYQGSNVARYTGSGEGGIFENTKHDVKPGQQITVSARYRAPGGGDTAGGRVVIRWFDGSNALIKAEGPTVGIHRTENNWHASSYTASAPAGAKTVSVSFSATINSGGGYVDVDSFVWNYAPPVAANLQYKAVQPKTGYSDTVEPVWPGVLGQTVVDNEVIWEAVSITRVVWEAEPILKTGSTEPVWPTTIGGTVADNTISWTAIDPVITDENCPNTKVVCIAKFKVFAGAGDIVRYSATLDPTDWTSEKNAGYIGTGMNQNSANEVSVLNLYRADLMVMNATTFQRWQIDPDPALMDMLDTMEGIGSRYHLACVPVANDLFYLANKGVRTIGVTGATKNMAAGDVGLPVDDIIKELLADLRARNLAGDNEEPLGLYWPSSGQYWLSFNRIVPATGGDAPGGPIYLCPSLQPLDEYAEVMVYTVAQTGQVGAWSRYVFPYRIDDWAQEGDDLYVRDGDTVYRIGEDVGACDAYEEGDGVTGLPFNGLIQWPWLDSGAPGLDKQMECFEVVGEGRGWFEFGYDQTAPGYFTTPYQVEPDTLPGTPVPMPLNAPSYSVRVRYDGWNPATGEGNESWSLNAISMQFT